MADDPNPNDDANKQSKQPPLSAGWLRDNSSDNVLRRPNIQDADQALNGIWQNDFPDDGIAKRGALPDEGAINPTPPSASTTPISVGGATAMGAASGRAQISLTGDLEALHSAMLKAATSLAEVLEEVRKAGIGHNNPPENINPWDEPDLIDIRRSVDILKHDTLATTKPPETAISAVRVLEEKRQKLGTFLGLSSSDLASGLGKGALYVIGKKAMELGLDPNTWTFIYDKLEVLIHNAHAWINVALSMLK